MSESYPAHIANIGGDEEAFLEIVRLIVASRERAIHTVNTTLIDLYWQVGETISRKIEAAEWGDSVVEALAEYIRSRYAP